MEEIIRRIKIFEGFRAKPYVCPAGKLTVGYGYNFEDRGFAPRVMAEIIEKGFTEELAERLLRADVQECLDACAGVFRFFGALSEPRRAVIADMVYQLGLAGLQKFKKMLIAAESGDFDTAADEMKNSRWYAQSGRRSLINTEQMRTGEWQEVNI